MTITLIPKGNTDTAQYVDNNRYVSEQYFRNSISLGKQTAYEELITVWIECRQDDWDGYGALPVSEETVLNAYQFIEALPLDYPLPSIGAEPDGHLTLEWYRHPRWILSVSISSESNLYYAALFGQSDVRGSYFFLGEIPTRLLNLIQEVQLK